MKGLGNEPQIKFLLSLQEHCFYTPRPTVGTPHNIINIFSELGLLAKHSGSSVVPWVPWKLQWGFGLLILRFLSQECVNLWKEPLAVSPQGVQREGKEIQIALSKMCVKIMNNIFLSIKTFLSLLITKLMKHQLQSVQCNQ